MKLLSPHNNRRRQNKTTRNLRMWTIILKDDLEIMSRRELRLNIHKYLWLLFGCKPGVQIYSELSFWSAKRSSRCIVCQRGYSWDDKRDIRISRVIAASGSWALSEVFSLSHAWELLSEIYLSEAGFRFQRHQSGHLISERISMNLCPIWW